MNRHVEEIVCYWSSWNIFRDKYDKKSHAHVWSISFYGNGMICIHRVLQQHMHPSLVYFALLSIYNEFHNTQEGADHVYRCWEVFYAYINTEAHMFCWVIFTLFCKGKVQQRMQIDNRWPALGQETMLQTVYELKRYILWNTWCPSV